LILQHPFGQLPESSRTPWPNYRSADRSDRERSCIDHASGHRSAVGGWLGM